MSNSENSNERLWDKIEEAVDEYLDSVDGDGYDGVKKVFDAHHDAWNENIPVYLYVVTDTRTQEMKSIFLNDYEWKHKCLTKNEVLAMAQHALNNDIKEIEGYANGE